MGKNKGSSPFIQKEDYKNRGEEYLSNIIMRTPLEQFKIIDILNIRNKYFDISITNSTIYMFLSIILIYLFIKGIYRDKNILGNKWQQLIELIYIKLEELIKEIIGEKNIRYFPFLFSLFLFILINNLIGMVPYSFTITSHFIVNLTLSLSIMIGVTLIGIYKYKFYFIKLFIPSGLGDQIFIKIMIPLIFCIEIISYLSRIFSLSVRLTANISAGHTLLKIIANFGIMYTYFYPYIIIVIPLVFLCGVFLLEIAVAFIQAYVFMLLTATYINDAENLH